MKLGTVVETNSLWATDLRDDALERLDHIRSAEVLPHLDRRRQSGEGVDDGQHADLATVEELVMNEVHRPNLIRRRRRRSIVTQLRLDASAERALLLLTC